MNQRKILIVDDDQSVLSAITKILQRKYLVTSVSSAIEAVTIIKAEKIQFDLILTDLHMPDMNGASFYIAITEFNEELKDKIMFMTGGQFSGYVDEFHLTNNPCLKKPFTVTELYKAVDDFFTNKNLNNSTDTDSR